MGPISRKSLEERLAAHPRLRDRVERLVDVVENSGGDVVLADEAERRVIAEVRQLGLDVLQSWSEREIGEAVKQARSQRVPVKGHGKKNSGGTRRSDR